MWKISTQVKGFPISQGMCSSVYSYYLSLSLSTREHMCTCVLQVNHTLWGQNVPIDGNI